MVLALALIIVSILLLLAGGQLLNFTIGVDYILVANAQSNDSAKILVPSNMSEIEINSKNRESESINSIYVQLITGLSSAGAAILGGFLVTYMTNKREREKERNIQAEKRTQKEEYNQKVTALTYRELKEFSDWLHRVNDERWWRDRKKDEQHYIRMLASVFQTFGMEYLNIPYEIRLTLFSPDVMYAVQEAYTRFKAFTKALFILIEEQQKNPTDSFGVVVKTIEPAGIKEYVDDAIIKLVEILPPDIIKKFNLEK